MNIWYVRAAIEAFTGQRLTFDEVIRYLIEEDLISKAKAKNLIFPGYASFYGPVEEKRDIEVVPVDRIIHD